MTDSLFDLNLVLETAKHKGTPFYIYNSKFIQDRILSLESAFNDQIDLYYAAKANPNFHMLSQIRQSCAGVDLSSGGELTQCLKAGFEPGQMSFAGPAKSDDELTLAIQNKIGFISIESLNELDRVQKISRRLNIEANTGLRINPKQVFKEFAIKMGGRASQFGIDEELAMTFFEKLKKCPNCRYAGIHIYSGTQCLKPQALLDNFNNTLEIVENITRQSGMEPCKINFGGGFGVPYHDGQDSFDFKTVCSEMAQAFKHFKSQFNLPKLSGIIELGRFITGEAGWFVTRVADKKVSRGKTYCLLDGGMNHHLPASGNFGQILRKNFKMLNLSNPTGEQSQVTFAGPLCTTIDIMAEKITINEPRINDIIAFENSGAYAFSASPLYFLSHPAPAEYLLENDKKLITIRESFQPF